MHQKKIDCFVENADRFRRSVHDVSAALIAIRALAEALSDHLPLVVALSRAKDSVPKSVMSPRTLDSLPMIPGEILELCEIARSAMQSMGSEAGAKHEDPMSGTAGLPTSIANASCGKPNGRGAAVLLVEDDDTARYVLLQTLRVQGCRVTTATDGNRALRLFEERDFDLVLMDLRMPGMSGWEAVVGMRQRECARGRCCTRIVGLTASPMLVDQQRARAAGMDEVLVKPIDALTLRSMVAGLRTN